MGSPSVATLSPPPLSARLSVTSRRSSATSPWTSSRRCPPPLPPPPSRSPTSFPTVRSSPSATRDSGAPRLSSSNHVRDLQHASNVCCHPSCPFPLRFWTYHRYSWTLVMVYPTPSPSMKVMRSPMPSSVWTWLAVSSPTTSRRSLLSVVTLSPPLLSVRLSVTSRRNSAMLPLTSSKKWLLLLPPPPWKSPMSFLTVKLSPLAMRGSVPLRLSSNPLSWEWNPVVSMRPPTTPS